MSVAGSSYVLEGREEFARLERQSSHSEYDFRRELQGLYVKARGKVLDAGCGSGIVSRFLASSFPEAMVTACDLSPLRIEQAKQNIGYFSNMEFKVEDLANCSFADESFDVVVCRYVMQHVTLARQQQVVAELVRCLKPGGSIFIVDADGVFLNLYPQSLEIRQALAKIVSSLPVDFKSGRKIPSLLIGAGVRELLVRAETISFVGEGLEREIALMRARFEGAAPALATALGGEVAAQRFRRDYIKALGAPESFYFHTMFSVVGRKQSRS